MIPHVLQRITKVRSRLKYRKAAVFPFYCYYLPCNREGIECISGYNLPSITGALESKPGFNMFREYLAKPCMKFKLALRVSIPKHSRAGTEAHILKNEATTHSAA